MPDQTTLTPIEEQLRAWEEYHRKEWMEAAELELDGLMNSEREAQKAAKPGGAWTEKDEDRLQRSTERIQRRYMWTAAERFSDWLSEHRPDVETALSEIAAQQSEWAEQGA